MMTQVQEMPRYGIPVLVNCFVPKRSKGPKPLWKQRERGLELEDDQRALGFCFASHKQVTPSAANKQMKVG